MWWVLGVYGVGFIITQILIAAADPTPISDDDPVKVDLDVELRAAKRALFWPILMFGKLFGF